MKKDRRNFLGKFSLAVTSFLGLGFRTPNVSPSKQEQTMENNPIIRTKPLGFQWETADPFLFCVHHDDKFPKGNDNMGPVASLKGRNLGQDFLLKDGWRMYHGKTVPGFPGHPHRGFETITVVRKGMVDHADSLGGSGRYGDGDTQWMTAGKGVQHSEMFPLLDKENENPMELFQIWINLPKKDKWVDAHYKMLWRDTIPIYKHTDSKGKKTEVEIIAGAIDHQSAPKPTPNSWASNPENNVAVWIIKLEANASWKLPKAALGVNRTLYYYEGNDLVIEGKSIKPYHAIEVLPDQELSLQNGNSEAKILLLQGKPIAEPVVQHGPFVMNSKEEIQEAFADYQQTKFGGWPWPKYDQVHDRSLGRFAKHADGTIDSPKG